MIDAIRKDVIMAIKIEYCKKCDKAIKKSEQAYIEKEHIICSICKNVKIDKIDKEKERIDKEIQKGLESDKSTGINNLNIITSGLVPPNATELLNSSRMSEILAQVKVSYDIVLIVSSPVLTTTDAVIVATKADGVVMIYQVGQVARGALKRAKTQLENAKATVIGVVLNGLKPETGKDYKDYGYYGYYYGYGSESEERQVPWYKRWFKMPIIVVKFLEKVKGKEEEEPGISEEKHKNGIAKWFKMPDIINILLGGKDSGKIEPPMTKPARKSWSEREGKSYFKEGLWKRCLKIIILVIASTFIFYGLLCQFGILKY